MDGLKTGYEDTAGSTIAVTAKKDNLRLIGVSLGYENANLRNTEAMNLLDYGFNQYESKVLFKKGEKLKTINSVKANNSFDLVTKEDIIVVSKRGDNPKSYSYDIKLNNIKYPIKKHQKVGELSLKSTNKIIGVYEVISNINVEKAGLFKQYLNVLSDTFSGK